MAKFNNLQAWSAAAAKANLEVVPDDGTEWTHRAIDAAGRTLGVFCVCQVESNSHGELRPNKAPNKGKSSDVKKKGGFKEDYRESNPSLHGLYLKTAVGHLRLIDKALKVFHRQSNLNLSGVIAAMQKERDSLVKDNAAYADAQAILEVYKTPDIGKLYKKQCKAGKHQQAEEVAG